MRERKGSLSVQNSIQTRLSFVMALVMVFVVCINFFIFEQIHTGVDRIDAVFSSNAAINDLSDTLNKLEGTVYEYLNIKGTKALENYYRYEQDYRELLDKLNDRNVDNEVKMLEKNIRRMSESYLNQTSETVQAKRGRNIEKYKASYEKELQLYEYINSYIYKLNNLRFRMNSSNYQLLLSSMDVLYRLALVVIFIVAAVGVAIIILFVQSMIRPLTQLSSTAHEVAMGNLNVPCGNLCVSSKGRIRQARARPRAMQASCASASGISLQITGSARSCAPSARQSASQVRIHSPSPQP